MADECVEFRGRLRDWESPPAKVFAVVGVPDELVARLGGRTHYHVTGSVGGAPFPGTVMLVAGPLADPEPGRGTAAMSGERSGRRLGHDVGRSDRSARLWK
jgi:hypothetical protein